MKKTSVQKELKRKLPRFFDIDGKTIYGYDKVEVFNEEKIGVAGAKYQIVSFPKGASVPSHMHHKVREIFLVQDGRGKITINKKKFLAKKGDIFLIQPGDFHALSNSSGKAFVINIFKWNEDRKDIFWTKK